MSYYPIKKAEDLSNPADTNAYLTIQGLINALNNSSSKTGTNTQSGNGNSTMFSIPHGLGVKPAYFNVISISQASGNIAYITADTVNLNVYYSVAPISGTNNLSWNWIVTKPQ